MPEPEVVKQLFDFAVDEISLVDRGANQHARVLISKRDVSKANPTASSLHHDQPLNGGRKKKRRRFGNDEEDVVSVLDRDEDEDDFAKADADDELLALLERLAERRRAQNEEAPEEEFEDELPEDELPEDELPEDEFDEEESEEEPSDNPFAGDEEEEPGEEELPEDELLGELEAEDDEPKAMPGDLPEEVAEYVNMLERSVEALERKFREEGQAEVTVGKAQEDDDMPDDDVNKNDLTEEEIDFLTELSKAYEDGEADTEEVVAKALEEVRKAQERAEAAERLAKAERDLREQREYIAKVEREYAHLPIAATELGPVLQIAKSAMTEEQFGVLERALASREASRGIFGGNGHGMFGEVGKRGGATESVGKVEGQARELVSKGEAKTMEEAVAKVYSAHPELYEEYLAEQG